MGSDTSPRVLFEAVLQAAQHFDASHTFIVLATKDVVEELSNLKHLVFSSTAHAHIEFHLVSDVITMCDEPLSAVRHKKGSSLVVGIRLLKKHLIDALISAGNTGALITGVTLSLPMLPGINRPALLAMLPTEKGSMAMIDVGGNVSCKAHHLVQFANMGAAVQRCSKGIAIPKVGLMNIGVESKKGTSELRQAYQVLQQFENSPKMKFEGNIEAREVLKGKVDVLVTDGFTGNVLLKSIEGVSAFILDHIWESCGVNASDKLKHSLHQLQSHFRYDEYPGAIVCGVDGVVVKCHGNSSQKAFFNGIKGAVLLVQKSSSPRSKNSFQFDTHIFFVNALLKCCRICFTPTFSIN